ncbi:MAG: hypothetical protein FWE90_06515 [Defluviitaleaceae bacterium]|nr:hypothetical protein [Defluviitaleaceae bacterium]
MNLDSTNLVLRYNPSGQYTFRRFDRTASDAALYALAKQVNAFQTDEAKVVKIQVFSVW